MRIVRHGAGSVLIGLAVSTLAGCGQATTASSKVESVIYASLDDCVVAGRLKAAGCEAAIESAINSHEKNAPRYRKIEDCEKTEGDGSCERTGSGQFLPRPAGFLVNVTGQPKGQALYYNARSGTLRAASGTTYKPDGDVAFSERARDFVEDGKGRRRG